MQISEMNKHTFETYNNGYDRKIKTVFRTHPISKIILCFKKTVDTLS